MSEGAAGTDQLRRLLDAVMTVGSDLDLDTLLHRLVDTAVQLVGARYGALGVLDEQRTHLAAFLAVGFTPEEVEAVGELPKGHGILGLLITDPRPLRLPDLNRHPDRFGFPPGHPPMTSFLGVPVFVAGVAFGNLYMTDKRDGDRFTDVDEELAVALAVAAGTAIEKARLHARTRQLDVVEDRDRIARELHDTVIQQLFATGLSLQGAARLADADLAARIETCVDDLDRVVRQIRSSIFDLRPPATATAGLRQRVLEVGDALADALGRPPRITFDGPIDARIDDVLADHLVAVVGEALTNVARHADATVVEVRIAVEDAEVAVSVRDDGRGLGPRRPGGRGLTNLEDRAAAVGGRCTVVDRPPSGTELRWWAPIT